MKTREEIITSMCYTYRHDYGLDKDESFRMTSGLTVSERNVIWNKMAQIFDNDIAPYMKFKEQND